MDLNFEFLDSEQPGPRDAPIQCYIRRERPTGTYRLYLGLSPGKILICFYFLSLFPFLLWVLLMDLKQIGLRPRYLFLFFF